MILPDFNALVLDPGLAMLPNAMDTHHARVMLRTIAMQESRIKHRKQIRGPARGWWQFERAGGTAGVLKHRASAKHAAAVCQRLEYPAAPRPVYDALAHNDTLACVFARLLLWTLPMRLPTTAEEGWRQYIEAWRPGRPHPATWARFWDQASAV